MKESDVRQECLPMPLGPAGISGRPYPSSIGSIDHHYRDDSEKRAPRRARAAAL